MLVSLMNSFRAIAMQHDAGFGMMQARNSMLGAIQSINPHNPNFEALHQQDLKLSLDIANNQLKYQMATAMRDQADTQLKKERGLNLVA
ncbi:MAG: hypothetical protein E7Z93_07820 [Cyanobacteria bacterium SIG32]|nr:hypothetical protein [Cyanobacteria bacterium SIG32]